MPNPVSPNLIADAVVAAIRAIGLVVTPANPPTVPADVLLPSASVMKLVTPSLPSGVDPPIVVVTVGEGGEEGQTEVLGVMDLVGIGVVPAKINRYPTTVVIIKAGGGQVLGDDEQVRAWRTLIESAVGDDPTCFASVPNFNQVSTIGKAPFDGSLIPRDLKYSAQGFNVEVLESRVPA